MLVCAGGSRGVTRRLQLASQGCCFLLMQAAGATRGPQPALQGWAWPTAGILICAVGSRGVARRP